MKRLLALLLILAMALSLTGCLSPEAREERKQALNILNGGSDGAYALSTGATLDNQTLYDDGDIIVQLAGIRGTPTEPELVLAVKNGSRHTISFSADYLAVNNWQVDSWCDLYAVEPRSVALGGIECIAGLEQSGITDVATITLNFTVYDETSYQDIAAAGCTLTTSAADMVNLEQAPDGPVLVEEDGLLVKAVGLSSSPYGASLTLYVENNSGRQICLETGDAELNGEPLDLWFWDGIVPNSRRLLTETLYYQDAYEDVRLSGTDQLTFDLYLSDWDTGISLTTQSVTLTPEDF